ncbi:TRAP transporter small permease subunit [uncultured Marivita sp.]|uniref:TRAP transporter small permease n=1 Tax=uncultured Marivita sp. TaxID=888080 RepID=UPI00261D6966|nr:TRAP transporter small permease subunit [uncultured Marivita sp.]
MTFLSLPRARSAGRLLLDIVEYHLPAAMMITLVAVFLLQITFRYFFTPLIWPDELLGFLFLWIVLFAVGYAERNHGLIRFSVLRDASPPRVRRLMDIVGHAILLGAFVALIVPTLNYLVFVDRRMNPVLPMRMSWAYAPFMVFLLSLVVRFGWRLRDDIVGLIRGTPPTDDAADRFAEGDL